MKVSLRLLLPLFALLVGGTALAEIAVWPIDVDAPGWVEVELDVEVLARLGPAGGVEVRSPSGLAVPARRLLAAETRRCRAVEVGAVERLGDVYALVLDLGPMPGPHAALRFALEERTLAPGCRLEAQAGRGWREVARADLFRLGEGSGLDATWFDYPESRARRLRLLWPAAAGHPAVRAVQACEKEPQRAVARRPVDTPELVVKTAQMTRLRLVTPTVSVPLRALVLATGAEARPDAYRLSFAQDGRWQPWLEGPWPAATDELRVALGDAAFPGGALRLDLFGPSPRVVAATWEIAPQALRFRAETSGRYLLRAPARGTPQEVDRGGPEPHRGSLGALALDVAEVAAPALGAAPEERALEARFAIAGAGIPRGSPVALILPPEVTERQPARARLVFEERLVPARFEPHPEPYPVARFEAQAPAPVDRSRSRLPLPLASDQLVGSTVRIELLAALASGPFERRLHVENAADAPGTPEARLASAYWRCRTGAAPCALAVDFALPERRRGDGLFVTFEDGDAAPLGPIAVEVELPATRALFLWPGSGVELLLARTPYDPPRFDLSQLEAALELRPPLTARRGARQAVEAAWLERRPKLLLALGVALAGASLLVLLARLLPSRSGAASDPSKGDPPAPGSPG